MPPSIAYLSQGRLFLKDGAAAPRSIESRFGEAMRARLGAIAQRHAWKTQGSGAKFLGQSMPTAAPEDSAVAPVRVTSVCRGTEAGELIYSLESQDVGGVFALPASGDERRIFHGAGRAVRHLFTRVGHPLVACTIAGDKGTQHVALMRADGTELTEVTDGDAIDACPRFIPGQPKRLVYQSAGVGRDPSGMPMGLAPFAVQCLDLEKNDIETLIADPGFDHLSPQIDRAGTLYFIRRPYQSPGRVDPGRVFLDVLLMPYRLLLAVIGWFNFFTTRYSGKPLIRSGDTAQKSADLRQLMLWGNVVDADRELRKGLVGDETPALVPATWELMRRPVGGAPEVLTRGVLSFDIADDGTVVYTNGTAVYQLGLDRQRTRLCDGDLIEQVALIG